MLSLCVDAGWRGPVFHFRYNGDYDHDSADMARGLAARFGLEFDEIEVASEFDAFERAEGFFLIPETEAQREAVRWWQRTHQHQVFEHQRIRGWAGTFIGMRREESRVRSITLRRKGHLYRVQRRSGWTCCPLLDWTGRDVWARIAGQGLPYLARYDDAPDRVLERSEEIWMAVDCWRKGMAVSIRRRDPALWNALLGRYPQLSRA